MHWHSSECIVLHIDTPWRVQLYCVKTQRLYPRVSVVLSTTSSHAPTAIKLHVCSASKCSRSQGLNHLGLIWATLFNCDRPRITWLSSQHRPTGSETSTKQQIWLRTALCGGWCRRMALRNLIELHALPETTTTTSLQLDQQAFWVNTTACTQEQPQRESIMIVRHTLPTRHGMPPSVCNPDLWRFDLETGVWVASKVGNLNSKFGHARLLGSRIIRSVHVCDRLTKATLIAPSLRPNLVKIGHCEVNERSSGLPHKKKSGSAGLVPTPHFAQNSLKVVTPWPVQSTYRLLNLVRISCALPDLFQKDWFFGLQK